MPSSTRDLKRKIKSVNSTKQITNAFELVSTAKLRRARLRMEKSKPFFQVQRNTISQVLGSDKSIRSRYIGQSASERPLVIVISADRGLCAGYNVNVIRESLSVTGDCRYITVGKKASEYFSKRGYDVVESVNYISEKPEFLHTHPIAKKVFELFHSGEVDSVFVVYTEFVSTIAQTPTTTKLLPFEPSVDSEASDEIMNYEPSPEAVLEYIVPRYIQSQIFGAMVEASAAEQAARRLAMESATESAEEIIDTLTLSLNQARQSAITQEITEIVGGAEALK